MPSNGECTFLYSYLFMLLKNLIEHSKIANSKKKKFEFHGIKNSKI